MLLFAECRSILLQNVGVPSYAVKGKEAVLTCDYDLERQRLYQVKWYKGTHEFYRYSPSEKSRIKLFLVEDLKVDVSLVF